MRSPARQRRMSMARATGLTKRLGLTHPIIQAPMAGGGDTPRLVAAVSEAGGLGSIRAAYLTPAQIQESARAGRALAARPVGGNPFAPGEKPGGAGRRVCGRPRGAP